MRGSGDLLFYAAVQVYSALVLLLALFLPPRYTRGSGLAIVVSFYALAKVLEALDKPIFAAGHIVSGHTLKHLAAATAGYCILRMLTKAATHRAVPLNAFDAHPREPKLNQSERFCHFTYLPLWTSYSTPNGICFFRS